MHIHGNGKLAAIYLRNAGPAGKGSTVVVVSRDAGVLRAAGCMHPHRVNFLSRELARELFLMHAGGVPSAVTLEIVDNVV